ncbi:unnamed protein product [Amoebophrya sp. A25]|nr:unnamed protein product [Amoebophrya sp. A25]|eukprot:GSA25T00020370001.1
MAEVGDGGDDASVTSTEQLFEDSRNYWIPRPTVTIDSVEEHRSISDYNSSVGGGGALAAALGSVEHLQEHTGGHLQDNDEDSDEVDEEFSSLVLAERSSAAHASKKKVPDSSAPGSTRRRTSKKSHGFGHDHKSNFHGRGTKAAMSRMTRESEGPQQDVFEMPLEYNLQRFSVEIAPDNRTYELNAAGAIPPNKIGFAKLFYFVAHPCEKAKYIFGAIFALIATLPGGLAFMVLNEHIKRTEEADIKDAANIGHAVWSISWKPLCYLIGLGLYTWLFVTTQRQRRKSPGRSACI